MRHHPSFATRLKTLVSAISFLTLYGITGCGGNSGDDLPSASVVTMKRDAAVKRDTATATGGVGGKWTLAAGSGGSGGATTEILGAGGITTLIPDAALPRRDGPPDSPSDTIRTVQDSGAEVLLSVDVGAETKRDTAGQEMPDAPAEGPCSTGGVGGSGGASGVGGGSGDGGSSGSGGIGGTSAGDGSTGSGGSSTGGTSARDGSIGSGGSSTGGTSASGGSNGSGGASPGGTSASGGSNGSGGTGGMSSSGGSSGTNPTTGAGTNTGSTTSTITGTGTGTNTGTTTGTASSTSPGTGTGTNTATTTGTATSTSPGTGTGSNTTTTTGTASSTSPGTGTGTNTATTTGTVTSTNPGTGTGSNTTTTTGTVRVLAGVPGGVGSVDGTGAAARFDAPWGVAVDGAGNVYVADTANRTIRKVTTAGEVTTLAGSPGQSGSADGTGAAARFYEPAGVAVDGVGNVYVADYGNSTIRKVTAAGVVTTMAGSPGQWGSADGTGAAASFGEPEGVAVDGAGNVYVADLDNNTIRKVTAAGVVTTLAGSPGQWGSAGGTGTAARFYYPQGVAVDSDGNVYVADS